ncbi:helix-turn-helix domain-containing protein [Embleya sp. AB8]|uniref:helix-turn-helix domain-containing protein n=1 Tax=Embleya sp. AB8 TaxID=3156304 RepID=UPI003C79633F
MKPAMDGNSRRTLGRLLRYHREDRGWTGTEVGKRLGCSQAQVSRLEGGQRIPTVANLETLATAYQLSDEEYAELKRLRQQAREAEEPWWMPYNVGVGYARLLEAEESAVRLSDYQTVLIPGLLQTPAYALAVTGGGSNDLGRTEVDGYTELRLRRQKRLFDPRPLALEAIVTEAALRFVVAGKDAHRAQLRHLLDMVDQHEHVTILIIPYEAGEDGIRSNTFNVYEMPHGEADVAFGESRAGTDVFATPLVVRSYQSRFADLRNAALGPDESRDLLSSFL